MFNNKLNAVLTLVFITFLYSCKDNSITNNELSISKNIENSNSKNLEFNFYPKSTTNVIIEHEFYSLSYNEKFEQAEWVAYKLTPNMLTNQHFNRPYFIEDPLVKTNSADWKNYKKSSFDKGHLCPAGDMKMSQKAYNDTFFTSNISPQIHAFNDGVWNRLENKVRYWSQKYNGLYVVTGGVLKNNLPTIGRENVAVPDSFYKVLLYKNNESFKMIAFLVPSQDSQKPLYEFVIETDKLEKITGIDFYPGLPDNIENDLEKSADYKSWSF
jgi:endonuclease G, mitochondrial